MHKYHIQDREDYHKCVYRVIEKAGRCWRQLLRVQWLALVELLRQDVPGSSPASSLSNFLLSPLLLDSSQNGTLTEQVQQDLWKSPLAHPQALTLARQGPLPRPEGGRDAQQAVRPGYPW